MSEKQAFTLPDGRRIEVPQMSDDLPGYGARTEDTRCVRCGEEVDLIHRTDIASCIGKCHVCKLEDHPGEVCPQLVARVDHWWWRLRGFTGAIPGLAVSPPTTTRSNPSLLSAPPAIMLQALQQDIKTEDHSKLLATFQSIQQLQKASDLILSSIGSLVNNPASPTGILEKTIPWDTAELVSAADAITLRTIHMTKLLAHRLRDTMREAIKKAEGAEHDDRQNPNPGPSSALAVSRPVIPKPVADRAAPFNGVLDELTQKFQGSFIHQEEDSAPAPVDAQLAADDDDYPDTDPMEWVDPTSPPPRRPKVRFPLEPETPVKTEEEQERTLSETWVAPGFFLTASGSTKMLSKPPTPPRSGSPEEYDPLLKYPKRLLSKYHDRPEVKRQRR